MATGKELGKINTPPTGVAGLLFSPRVRLRAPASALAGLALLILFAAWSGWSIGWSLAVTFVVVIAFRGLVDVVIPRGGAGLIDAVVRFTAEIVASGVMRGGEALEDVKTATSVRVRNGQTLVTDGPFAETKEQLGGFYLIDVEDLDQAIALAVTGAKRSTIAPDIPTVRESGIPELKDFSLESYYGFMAPPGTPPAIARKVVTPQHAAALGQHGLGAPARFDAEDAAAQTEAVEQRERYSPPFWT